MRTGAIESNAAPRESVQQAQAAGTPLDEAARELGMELIERIAREAGITREEAAQIAGATVLENR